ncbi:hypothetical protein HMPREF0208_03623 [Citrobacter koseri]|nr:hypothetical protein HMPREF3207_04913 [Citrobacter koseri]KWZ98152.1 hypothetical protein HMPREF3220_02707 [Citrobacter koseri]KXB41633.1 hypothetical protein HMPREF0208_03623 [Citrobacter koseri]
MALRLSGLRVGYKMPDGTMLIRPTCRLQKCLMALCLSGLRVGRIRRFIVAIRHCPA